MKLPSLLTAALLATVSPAVHAADAPWINLLNGDKLDAFQPNRGDWFFADSVAPDAKNPRLLAGTPGSGILVNGPTGRTPDLVTRQSFGDLELHVEFLIPKGSNSGVKFQEVYEIQICDSHGKKAVTGEDCGGIYPRADLKPVYHHLDKGFAPKVNACKAPGEWQTLDVVWRAPRFDASGKKTANARVDKAILNGQVIHENQEVPTPTGHNWTRKETPTGPLLLQGDHGPVAFRHLKVRPLREEQH